MQRTDDDRRESLALTEYYNAGRAAMRTQEIQALVSMIATMPADNSAVGRLQARLDMLLDEAVRL